ncbi:MAG: ATP-binding protein, partial [Candidatus Zixiibacteriota bacterium]
NRKTACPQCLALKSLQTGKPQQIEFENEKNVLDIHWVPVGPDLYLNYIIDITDRKRNEQKIIKMEKLESIGVLAGGIAHDFNNLLTGILGNISLVKLDLNPKEEIYVNLDEVEKATIRAKDLTQQLLTFSKGGEPVKVISSISVLIKETVPFVLHGSNVKPEFSIADNLYSTEIDISQISQVLHNIVLNGNQAMPNGGKIKVSAENIFLKRQSNLPLKAGCYVKITIEDEGAGIPPEHIEKIFDPYFTAKQNGTGLGLSTSYSIIQKHKGNIEVESKIGKGSKFHIYLPATDQKAKTKEITPSKIIKGQGRILVMDDEALIRDLTKKILIKHGFTVDCVNDGAEAVNLYQLAMKKKKPYSVVILDLTIPNGMGGKETIEKLWAIDPQVKAIVCSGYSNDPVMSDYKKNFFSGVVSKPYRPIELVQAVNDLLNSDLISDTEELSVKTK